MRLRRVSASTAVRTGSALVQGVQSLLVLTLLPWFGDDNNTDDNNNHDNNNNDAAPDQEKEEGSLLLLAAPIIIAVLALGAVCPGLHFACRAEGWRHLLLQWLECVVAYPLALLALAIALGLRRLPRDARTYEALMGIAWVPPVLGLAADSMLRAALSRVERDGLLLRARMWVAPFGASCLGSLLCFGGLYARAWPSTPRLQCLFWSQALLCAAFGAVHGHSLVCRTRVIEDTRQQELVFYSARRLRDGRMGVVVLVNDATDEEEEDAVAAAANNNKEDEDEDGDDDEGGGGVLSMVPIARRKRVEDVEARHAPAFAALACVARTLLCWLVLGPRLLLLVVVVRPPGQPP